MAECPGVQSRAMEASSSELKTDFACPEDEHRLVGTALKKTLGQGALTILVFGASGHLARTKTYPSLFELFKEDVFPETTQIVGYARSGLTPEAFR